MESIGQLETGVVVGAWALVDLMNALGSGCKTPIRVLENRKVSRMREIRGVRVIGQSKKKSKNKSIG